MHNVSDDGTEDQELNTIEEETCTATLALKVHIDVIYAHWSYITRVIVLALCVCQSHQLNLDWGLCTLEVTRRVILDSVLM